MLQAVLRGVKQDVPDSGGAAAAAVVVPETRPEPFGDTGAQDRVQAPVPQPRDLLGSGDRQRRGDPGRQGLLGLTQRLGLADLGQHQRQAADPGIYRVAIDGRRARRSIVRHHLGQPWAIAVPDLTQNPRPRRLAQLPVCPARRHLSRLRPAPHPVRPPGEVASPPATPGTSRREHTQHKPYGHQPGGSISGARLLGLAYGHER